MLLADETSGFPKGLSDKNSNGDVFVGPEVGILQKMPFYQEVPFRVVFDGFVLIP